jgi:DNA-binding response OmpR family regulator
VKLLVVEDYPPLRRSLVQGLVEAGYAVDSTADGRESIEMLEATAYDVVVLDVMLPSLDGFEVVRQLRRRRHPAHVLLLTARDQVADRVEGLSLGADDYLVKPFAVAELLARVQALVRRKYDQKAPCIVVADLEVDTVARAVRRDGRAITLSAREYAILEYLARRAGQVVSRDAIWEHVYDFAAEPNSNVIDVYVAHLRRKLEADGRPRLLQTRRGFGYVLEAGT